MRTAAMMIRATALSLGITLACLASGRPANAQSPRPPAKLFANAADVTALIERAKRERKPDQANFVQPIVSLAPYNANLEYRVAGLNAAASVHERDAEMFLVLEGAGTVVTGGALKDERRSNPDNLQGSAIEGGASQAIKKGDWVMVPEKTPHWFTQIDGVLVLMSVHLPRTQ
jgi:mannose-6-phosphate isomerase-like protein (cupin superfamily)